jgi:predicted RNA-binding protein with PUA-like domain
MGMCTRARINYRFHMADRHYWLVKSEPDVFSYDDLVASPKRTTYWDGVRSYAARIHLRGMKKGDLVLFYHSMVTPAAIVGVAEVVREAYVDHTALDPKHAHFDPNSKKDDPTWSMVDIKAVEKLPRPVTLDELKKTKGLEKMALIKIGRLSVSPVSAAEYAIIRRLGEKADPSLRSG